MHCQIIFPFFELNQIQFIIINYPHSAQETSANLEKGDIVMESIEESSSKIAEMDDVDTPISSSAKLIDSEIKMEETVKYPEAKKSVTEKDDAGKQSGSSSTVGMEYVEENIIEDDNTHKGIKQVDVSPKKNVAEIEGIIVLFTYLLKEKR